MTSRPTIACLGAGRMGRGIAVAFAYAGHAVTLIDVKARSTGQFATLDAEALGEIKKTMASLAPIGLLPGEEGYGVGVYRPGVPVQNICRSAADLGMGVRWLPEKVDP